MVLLFLFSEVIMDSDAGDHIMEYSKEILIERAEEALNEIREKIKIAESYLYWKR